MIGVLAVVGGVLIVVELLALVGRRAWVHWKFGRRRQLVDGALTVLADAVASGAALSRPVGRVSRRSFRLAALELFPVLAGESRERLTRVVDGLGLVDDAMRTLARSPRAFARRTSADELGEIRSARAAPAFVAGLDDRDAIVRVACVRGLVLIDELRPVERMLDVLERDSAAAPSEASSAMVTIARTKPEALAQLQTSGSRFVAWLATLALARAGHAIAMPVLLVDLTAVNTLLGSVAVRAIEEVGGPEAIASLEQFVFDADNDAALRAQAGRALERLHAAEGAV
jgi:hypothetical protein